LKSYPGMFTAFRGIDGKRCEQVVAGYDSIRREVWFSWPTQDVDSPTNIFSIDSENVRRMTLTLCRLYGHSSLIDHGFSAFMEFFPWLDESVRDWMVSVGACDPGEIPDFILFKEGEPCNIPPLAQPLPVHLINETEDPTLPASPDSLCALYGEQDIKKMCIPCRVPLAFAMASLSDFCIKELAPDERFREIWDTADPLGVEGQYVNVGYEFLIQSESTLLGNSGEKRIYNLEVDLIQQDEVPALNMHAQIGVSPMVRPDCGEFWNSPHSPIDCSPIAPIPEMENARGVGPLSFPFFCTGRFLCYRLFLSASEADSFRYAPLGGSFDLTRVNLTLSLRSKC
jgi:hypothetical protein